MGIVWTIASVKLAESTSDRFLESVYSARVSFDSGPYNKADIKAAMDHLRDELDAVRITNYIIISVLMGIGTICIVTGRERPVLL